MYHPPINTAQSLKASTLEQDFALRTLEVFEAYRNPRMSRFGKIVADLGATDRVDVKSSDGSSLALRLIGCPAVARTNEPEHAQVGNSENVGTSTSSHHFVIGLQYGKLQDGKAYKHKDDIEDDDFDWKHYVLCLFDAEERETQLLDAQTGRELSTEDVLVVIDMLGVLATRLCQDSFESTCEEAKVGAYTDTYKVDGISDLVASEDDELVVEFDQTVDRNYECEDCSGASNEFCEHWSIRNN